MPATLAKMDGSTWTPTAMSSTTLKRCISGKKIPTSFRNHSEPGEGVSPADIGSCHTLRAIGIKWPTRIATNEVITVKSHEVAKHEIINVSVAHTMDRKSSTPIPAKSV